MLTDEQRQGMVEWIAALRSGTYRQGRSSLKKYLSADTVQYCCLGVRCELDSGVRELSADGPNGAFQMAEAVSEIGTFCNSGGAPAIALPSRDMFESWGLDYDTVNLLAEMNDGGREWQDDLDVYVEIPSKTFDEIADHLENTYL